MSIPLPTITVVTPSYNQGQYLEETICSVLDQGYPGLEYIVMDGGSTDSSGDILRKYGRHLTFWSSERDDGQTDAIRRGIARGTGEIVNWLNSDDLCAPGGLRHVAEMVQSNPGAGLYAAATENFNDGAFDSSRQKSTPSNITLRGFLFLEGRGTIRHQPGVFFRRSAYDAVGGFSHNYHICMDVELYVKMLVHEFPVLYSADTVAYFRRHGAAKTCGRSAENNLRYVTEYMEICEWAASRSGLVPDHRRAHIRRLVGAARQALRQRDARTLGNSLSLAMRLVVCGR